jgi:hypothetical protein
MDDIFLLAVYPKEHKETVFAVEVVSGFQGLLSLMTGALVAVHMEWDYLVYRRWLLFLVGEISPPLHCHL